jgi:hypothetical protein
VFVYTCLAASNSALRRYGQFYYPIVMQPKARQMLAVYKGQAMGLSWLVQQTLGSGGEVLAGLTRTLAFTRLSHSDARPSLTLWVFSRVMFIAEALANRFPFREKSGASPGHSHAHRTSGRLYKGLALLGCEQIVWSRLATLGR